MIDADVRSAFAGDGPATFATVGEGGPHLVATWQRNLEVIDDTTIAFPAGGYRVTEANLAAGSTLEMVVGSVTGQGHALGYRLSGQAQFQSDTPAFEQVKAKYPWCRAAVVLKVTQVEKILSF